MDYRKIYNEMSPEKKEKLKGLHQAAQIVCDEIDALIVENGSKGKIKYLLEYLENLEFLMQDVWGFERDANKHTWWLRPKSCTCPKIDNLDPAYYGNGKIIVSSCPLHGYEGKEEKK